MNLEIITVGNGSKNYPGNFTKKEIEIIRYNKKGRILHLFSGKSDIGHIRVDFKYGNCTMDVFDYLANVEELEGVRNGNFTTVIIDAPYNQRIADIYQRLGDTPKQFVIFASVKKTTELFDRIINISPEIIILKSWNYYVPKGYRLKKGYLCYAGGYRKPTILEILVKYNS